MIHEKYQARVCFLYDFKQGKTASESHQTLVNVFGEDVITTHQCQNRFKHFQDGNTSLEDYEHGKSLKLWATNH